MKARADQAPAWVPKGLVDAAKSRTADVVTRVRHAMKAMTAEVEEHDGLYPYNGGKINQSEVCRRAGISKVTLQGPIHKESTKVEIDEWVARAHSSVFLGKKSIRKTITERADSWKSAHNMIANQYHLAQLELVDAKQRIKELERENIALRNQLKPGGKVLPHKLRDQT